MKFESAREKAASGMEAMQHDASRLKNDFGELTKFLSIILPLNIVLPSLHSGASLKFLLNNSQLVRLVPKFAVFWTPHVAVCIHPKARSFFIGE